MQHFTYIAHESIPQLTKQLTHLWNVYGKINYKLSNKLNHELVNISVKNIIDTDFGKWITSEIGEIDNCKFFVCAPSVWGEAHIDGPGGEVHIGGPEDSRQCAINIPVANCDLGIMNWFSNCDEPKLIATYKTIVQTSGHRNDIEYWNVEDTMILAHTALVKTNQWHNIDNRLNPNPRIVFSVRLKDNPLFDDVQRKLKQWII